MVLTSLKIKCSKTILATSNCIYGFLPDNHSGKLGGMEVNGNKVLDVLKGNGLNVCQKIIGM
jgi:hypothetical protein